MLNIGKRRIEDTASIFGRLYVIVTALLKKKNKRPMSEELIPQQKGGEKAMKPSIDLICVAERAQDESGEEYYSGIINPVIFKKAKDDLRIILMPGRFLLASLIGNDPNGNENMYMFVQNGQERED